MRMFALMMMVIPAMIVQMVVSRGNKQGDLTPRLVLDSARRMDHRTCPVEC